MSCLQSPHNKLGLYNAKITEAVGLAIYIFCYGTFSFVMSSSEPGEEMQYVNRCPVIPKAPLFISLSSFGYSL
jgi:hypothetical protein